MSKKNAGQDDSGDWMAWLNDFFSGFGCDNSQGRRKIRGDFKRSKQPDMFELPTGNKGKPVIKEIVEVETMFKTIKKEDVAALKSSYHALLTDKELSNAKATSGKVYAKEATSAKQHTSAFEEQFGSEAVEIVETLFGQIKVTDPMTVPPDAEPDSWEERWHLDRDSRDVEGESMVHKLADIIRGVNRERIIAGEDPLFFTDPHFPPELSSLYADPASAGKNAGASASYRFDQDAFLSGVDPKSIIWKRPTQFGDTTKKPVIYSGGIDPNDVGQGSLGNCYYLAAIASCCIGDDDMLIRDLCVEECGDVGMYAVKFFINGKWRTVIVDDLIPCTEKGGIFEPLFAKPKDHADQSSEEKELWSLIFEKAWAKLHMSYEATDAGLTGDTTAYLTGGSVKALDLEQIEEESDRLRQWDELVKLYQTPSSLAFLSCSIRTGVMDGTTLYRSYGLVDGHAYSILDLKKVSNGDRLVNVRNPWGHTEWKGRYSDHSRDWTDQLRRETGHVAQEDGAFWMRWPDFIYFFGKVEVCDPAAICRLTEDGSARVDVVKCHWKKGKTAGGSQRCKSFDCNPVIQLKVKRSGPVEIAIYQPDTRPTSTVTQIHNIPLELYLVDVSSRKPKQLIVETTSRVGCYLMHHAEANCEYHLIPAAWAPGVESTIWVTASGSGCELTLLEPKTPTAEQAALMNCNNPRQMCCVVCRQNDDPSYYDTSEGLKCEKCKSKPVAKGVSASNAAPSAEKCNYCDNDVQPGRKQIQGGKTYCFPPCWQAPPNCYYCKNQITSTYMDTQYGPLCNDCGRRFGCI